MGAVEDEAGEHAAELPGLNLCLAGDGFLLYPLLRGILKVQVSRTCKLDTAQRRTRINDRHGLEKNECVVLAHGLTGQGAG